MRHVTAASPKRRDSSNGLLAGVVPSKLRSPRPSLRSRGSLLAHPAAMGLSREIIFCCLGRDPRH